MPERKFGRRTLLELSAKTVAYSAATLDSAIADLTLKKAILALGGLEGLNALGNLSRTIYSLNHTLQPNPPYDAIIVLGAGNALFKGKEVPSPDGQIRVIAGVEEYYKHNTKLIRFAGGARSGSPEAKIMAEYAISYAPVPISVIEEELSSIDTVSNLREIVEWKKRNPNVKKIGVSTNAHHMRGVQVLGKNLGLDLSPVVAEQILVDTGKPDLIKKVEDLYADSSFSSGIDKEQARLAMLLIDPESHVSHERGELQKGNPILQFAFERAYELLALAGKELFPFNLRPTV